MGVTLYKVVFCQKADSQTRICLSAFIRLFHRSAFQNPQLLYRTPFGANKLFLLAWLDYFKWLLSSRVSRAPFQAIWSGSRVRGRHKKAAVRSLEIGDTQGLGTQSYHRHRSASVIFHRDDWIQKFGWMFGKTPNGLSPTHPVTDNVYGFAWYFDRVVIQKITGLFRKFSKLAFGKPLVPNCLW